MEVSYYESTRFKLFKSYFFVKEDFLLKKLLLTKLAVHYPLFGFYIEKTDKLRKKHSRGKIDKFKLI